MNYLLLLIPSPYRIHAILWYVTTFTYDMSTWIDNINNCSDVIHKAANTRCQLRPISYIVWSVQWLCRNHWWLIHSIETRIIFALKREITEEVGLITMTCFNRPCEPCLASQSTWQVDENEYYLTEAEWCILVHTCGQLSYPKSITNA